MINKIGKEKWEKCDIKYRCPRVHRLGYSGCYLCDDITKLAIKRLYNLR